MLYDHQFFGEILDSVDIQTIILFLCAIPLLFVFHICQRSLMATSNFKINNIISISRNIISIFCLVFFVLIEKNIYMVL